LSDRNPDIEIRIQSHPRHLCVLRAAVEAASQRMDFDDKACGEISLAVDEAVTNVIRHGYQQQPDRPIWLKLTSLESNGRSGLQIVIEDECGEVDLAKIRSRALEDIKPGGLGVHIVTAIMDEAQYDQRPNNVGLMLTMRKYV
jgi:anti-sigma regulatory factor (Ser/Thr protein kinase)